MTLDEVDQISTEELYENKFMNQLFKGIKTVFLLWLISQKKIHGYKIISKINEMNCFNNDVKFIHGSTVYPLLHSLEEKGLIKSSIDYNGKKKVKVYEITENGVLILNSIKKSIKDKPDNTLIKNYFDDMFFNDKEFTLPAGE